MPQIRKSVGTPAPVEEADEEQMLAQMGVAAEVRLPMGGGQMSI